MAASFFSLYNDHIEVANYTCNKWVVNNDSKTDTIRIIYSLQICYKQTLSIVYVMKLC